MKERSILKNSEERTHSAICPKCKGNGYIRYHQNVIQFWNWGLGYSRVRDCETCNNQGEIVYEEPKIVPFNDSPDCPHN